VQQGIRLHVLNSNAALVNELLVDGHFVVRPIGRGRALLVSAKGQGKVVIDEQTAPYIGDSERSTGYTHTFLKCVRRYLQGCTCCTRRKCRRGRFCARIAAGVRREGFLWSPKPARASLLCPAVPRRPNCLLPALLARSCNTNRTLPRQLARPLTAPLAAALPLRRCAPFWRVRWSSSLRPKQELWLVQQA